MEKTTRTLSIRPSTTWSWEYRKIRVLRRQAPGKTARSALSGRLPHWNRREPLTITVKYRGGAESWVELRARGRTWRAPGHLALFDVLSEIWGDAYSRPESPALRGSKLID